MPQIFPMNWIFLSLTLMLSIILTMAFIYSMKLNNTQSSIQNKKKQFSLNYQW
nr:ATP synthase F0 subunit 8 [Dermacentor rhinocerinus]QLD97131.1 ATP synthase F0 subunit 8 [Dermacentor rhinocerinus]